MNTSVNILYIINEQFRLAAEAVLNPVNAMFISKNDGMFDSQFNHQRDVIVNANTLVQLSRDNYSRAQLLKIKELQRGHK